MTVVEFRPKRPTLYVEKTDPNDPDAGWSVIGVLETGERSVLGANLSPAEALDEIDRFADWSNVVLPNEAWRSFRP